MYEAMPEDVHKTQFMSPYTALGCVYINTIMHISASEHAHWALVFWWPF